MEEYGARYLFTPLGITDYPWKRSPSGEVDAEGGLYLRPSDLAKIWYLVLRSGTWEGQQIVDADWLRDSLTPQAAVPSTGLKYGRLWWFYPYPSNSSRGAWAGIGFGGQLPIVFPDYDMVVVFTGWNLDPEKPQLELEKAIERVLRVVAKESRAGSKE